MVHEVNKKIFVSFYIFFDIHNNCKKALHFLITKKLTLSSNWWHLKATRAMNNVIRQQQEISNIWNDGRRHELLRSIIEKHMKLNWKIRHSASHFIFVRRIVYLDMRKQFNFTCQNTIKNNNNVIITIVSFVFHFIKYSGLEWISNLKKNWFGFNPERLSMFLQKHGLFRVHRGLYQDLHCIAKFGWQSVVKLHRIAYTYTIFLSICGAP